MSNKRILMFCFPTGNAYYFAKRYIEALGYEVSLREVESVQQPNAISLIDEDDPYLLTQDSLADYDVLAIAVSEQRTHRENPLISREFIATLKERVKSAEIKRGNHIRVVGINFGLSTQELQGQREIFEGLFIGSDTTEEEIHKYLD